MSTISFRKTVPGIALAVAAIVQSAAFAQSAPPVNNTDCGTLTSADIGGSSDITLAGSNVTNWDVTYNGVTTNLPPSPSFTITNIVGDVQDVTIAANGFDGMNPVSDQIVCSIPYNPPTCSAATQDPDSTVTPVDPGTVLTLSLDTTNAVSTTIDAIPMTPDVDPNTNFGATWTATTTAISNSVITAVSTNPEGETTQCTWNIQVNNQPPPPPTITQPPDGSTVLIEGFVNEEFVAEWTESTDPDGDPVTYEWELAADPGFSTVLLQIPGLTDTRVVLTLEAVDQLLSSNGVNVGDSITLFHRATASDGFSASEGPAAEVTLTLGNVFRTLPTQSVPTLGAFGLGLLVLLTLSLAFFGLRKTG